MRTYRRILLATLAGFLWTSGVVVKAEDVNEKKALAIVMKRKEVAAWLKAFDGPDKISRKTGGRASFRVDGHKKDVYTVQVVEIMEDHDATFGWYKVNVRTGAVTNESE